MSSILVVGSKGQLGGELMRRWGPRARGFELPELDITSETAVRELIDEIGPEVS